MKTFIVLIAASAISFASNYNVVSASCNKQIGDKRRALNHIFGDTEDFFHPDGGSHPYLRPNIVPKDATCLDFDVMLGCTKWSKYEKQDSCLDNIRKRDDYLCKRIIWGFGEVGETGTANYGSGEFSFRHFLWSCNERNAGKDCVLEAVEKYNKILEENGCSDRIGLNDSNWDLDKNEYSQSLYRKRVGAVGYPHYFECNGTANNNTYNRGSQASGHIIVPPVPGVDKKIMGYTVDGSNDMTLFSRLRAYDDIYYDSKPTFSDPAMAEFVQCKMQKCEDQNQLHKQNRLEILKMQVTNCGEKQLTDEQVAYFENAEKLIDYYLETKDLDKVLAEGFALVSSGTSTTGGNATGGTTVVGTVTEGTTTGDTTGGTTGDTTLPNECQTRVPELTGRLLEISQQIQALKQEYNEAVNEINGYQCVAGQTIPGMHCSSQ